MLFLMPNQQGQSTDDKAKHCTATNVKQIIISISNCSEYALNASSPQKNVQSEISEADLLNKIVTDIMDDGTTRVAR